MSLADYLVLGLLVLGLGIVLLKLRKDAHRCSGDCTRCHGCRK